MIIEEMHVRPKEGLIPELGARLESLAKYYLKEKGSFHFALAGGGTPLALYKYMRDSGTFPHHEIDYYFGDERRVPPDHPDSNYRAAVEVLFPSSTFRIESLKVHRMIGEEPDGDKAAREYEALLPESLDVVLLGMGEDGHTASLFPGAPALKESERLVAATKGPKPPPDRLTLTLKAINAARFRFLLFTGEGKREPAKRLLFGGSGGEQLPVQMLESAAIFCDPKVFQE